MPGARKNFIGREGFIWFIGVVEDRNDPEKMNRVRVRCFGWHTEDKQLIPTDSLPWAHPVLPPNNPMTAYNPKEGDMVFGFFLDGDSAQNPVILGIFPGKPTELPNFGLGFSDPNKKYPKKTRLNEPTNTRLARGKTDDTVIATRKKNQTKGIKSAGGVVWNQPSAAYAAKYPYNYAQETESGHAFELDDTPGKERVHLAHKTGTFMEVDANGSKVEKVVKDNYTLVMGSDYIYVSGTCSVTVDGNCNLRVGGKLNVEASEINLAAAGDVKIKGSAVKIESSGEMDVKAGGKMKIGGGGKASFSGSTATIQGAVVDIAGGMVNLQSGSADKPSGTGLSATGGPSGATSGTTTSTTNLLSTTGGIAAAKGMGGLSGTVSDTYSTVKGLAEGGLQTLSSNMPQGELENNMLQVQDKINPYAGSVAGLPEAQNKEITGLVGNLSNTANSKGITLSFEESLLPAAPKENASVGKRLFPRTETVANTANTG